MSQPNTVMRHISIGRYDALGAPSPPSNSSRGPQSPLVQSSSSLNPGGSSGLDSETHRLQEEISNLRGKLHSWEESWNQAKQVGHAILVCPVYIFYCFFPGGDITASL